MKQFEIVKFSSDKFELDVTVSPLEETVWLSLNYMSKLFERDKSVISRYIKSVIKDNSLIADQVVAKNATTGPDGKTYVITYYNLDVIIPVGYKVHSQNGILFRKWANRVLKEYLIKGYVIDESRTLINDSNYLALVNKVKSIDERLSKYENQRIDKEKIFFDGEIFDAKSFLCSLFGKAEKQIILIDPYADIKALDYLKVKNKNVDVIIYHNSIVNLSNNDVDVFNNQYNI